MTSKSTDAVTVKKVEIDSDDSFNKMIGFHFSYSLFYISLPLTFCMVTNFDTTEDLYLKGIISSLPPTKDTKFSPLLFLSFLFFF